MTLKFNPAVANSNSLSLMNSIKSLFYSPLGSAILYVYDSATVPFPSVVPAAGTLAANALAGFSIANSSVLPVLNGSVYLPTPIIATANVTGNIGWWAITSSQTVVNATFISDSVSIYGGNTIATFSSMTTTSGSELVLTSFTLKFSQIA